MKLLPVLLILFAVNMQATNTSLTHIITYAQQMFLRKKAEPVIKTDNMARIGIISITGTMNSVAEYAEKLFKLYRAPNIDAILIHMNSNGGNGGEALYPLIKQIRLKKPVVVLIETNCCSSAYWAASAAHYIVAPSGANIGSIGSIWEIRRDEHTKVKANDYEAGTSFEVIWAGKNKAILNPHQPALNEEQRNELQNRLDEHYEIFCEEVAASRNISYAERSVWAEGNVFSGRQAVKLKLIDEVGSLFEAIDAIMNLLKKMSNKTFTDIELIR